MKTFKTTLASFMFTLVWYVGINIYDKIVLGIPREVEGKLFMFIFFLLFIVSTRIFLGTLKWGDRVERKVERKGYERGVLDFSRRLTKCKWANEKIAGELLKEEKII